MLVTPYHNSSVLLPFCPTCPPLTFSSLTHPSWDICPVFLHTHPSWDICPISHSSNTHHGTFVPFSSLHTLQGCLSHFSSPHTPIMGRLSHLFAPHTPTMGGLSCCSPPDTASIVSLSTHHCTLGPLSCHGRALGHNADTYHTHLRTSLEPVMVKAVWRGENTRPQRRGRHDEKTHQ